jgi:subtilisin family serine protease
MCTLRIGSTSCNPGQSWAFPVVLGKARQRRVALCLTALLSLAVIPAQAQDLVYTRQDHSPKLEGVLARLHKTWAEGRQGLAKTVAAQSGIGLGENGEVTVILVPVTGQLSASITDDAVRRCEARVVSRSRHLMKVLSPVVNLDRLSQLEEVAFVRLPIAPSSTAVVSEGVAAANIQRVTSKGYGGDGMKVAVIDIGFKGLQGARASGDLPDQWVEKDFSGTGIEGQEVHGTACAEIVYDVAPRAELYLYRVSSLHDLENAKDAAIQEGIGIVSVSLAWLGSGFGDGLGHACDIVDDAFQNNVLWVNAAGNYGARHYSSLMQDPDSDGFHNFSESSQIVELDGVRGGQEIRLWLTWNEWPLTQQDYDLLLVALQPDGTWEQVSVSDTNQAQYRSEPQERLVYTVPRDGRYAAAIWKDAKARTTLIKLVSENHGLQQYVSLIGSITIPADAKGAFTVGAMDYQRWTAGPVEEFSSRGPTVDGRVKPDLVGPDRVSTYSYGAQGFPGTSAATPHVAGAAALIRSLDPKHYTATRLREVLSSETIDMGTSGKDNTFGWGRLDLSSILSGQPEIVLFVEELDFGEVLIGQTKSLALDVFNSGTVSLAVSSIRVSNLQDFDLGVSSLTVPPQRTESLSVTFNPRAEGVRTSTVSISSNDPARALSTATLRGTGTRNASAPAPRLALTPASLTFDSVQVGASSQKTVSVANLGNATLTVSGVASSDSRVTAWPQKLSIPPQEARGLNVTFTPDSPGKIQIHITVSSSDPEEPQTLLPVACNAIAAGPAQFSIALDAELPESGGAYTLEPDEVIHLNLVGSEVLDASGFSAVFSYDAAQITYAAFQPGSDIPDAHSPGPLHQGDSRLEVTAASFGGTLRKEIMDLGAVSFRPTPGFENSEIILLSARLRRAGRFEYYTGPVSIRVRLMSQLPADFDGDRHVGFSDFILFAQQYGQRRGDQGYEPRFDLDESGAVDFRDFLVFARDYGSSAS